MNKPRYISPAGRHNIYLGNLPKALTLISAEAIADLSQAIGAPQDETPVLAWMSRSFVVQVYEAGTTQYPHLKRMTVNRATKQPDGEWQDGITWDELQDIKSQIGYGDWWGVEMYPPEGSVQNIHNFRHLWLNPDSFGIGFKEG